ncbi:endonuclease/exonuclease/phosphatase family protein [Streptomyces sp. AK02-01A]|uniref:endonuclease/exonuclease/phosphatase family protein n=1 Tax=Streptomyces sp. AK02-01A TaxID=3028648 RepID=UPI0029BB3BD4|nr:endonuclease/exonuclease/phosphatase family protein [Streptomyces sp. AK02-01A]MDX3849619.1 lamin tail domain-containing protein [Streptomyces sp. AK02-01A]MDX3849811.1 lamin tail domain-containing protein [Streptomyces sp. AK02-01A]
MPPSIPSALRGRRARFLALTIPVGLAGSLLALPINAQAASPDAVIAEVYGGGGNSGATLTNDFIELGNSGDGAFDLTGWSVQYLSGSPSSGSKWQVTEISGAIPAGGSYLVEESKGAGGTTALPTPDAAGTIPMSATSGTVALVHSTTPLTCLTAADCAADPGIKDLVGFGTAVVRETAPATGAGNTTSVSRNAALGDTDDNSADLAATAPAPRNSAGGGGDEPSPTPSPTDTTPGELRIHDIQGSTRLSPKSGATVANVPGVVTGVRSTGSSRGFWFQDSEPDKDPATSEGVFVFTGSATPQVRAGDSVLVSGKVSEYYPGGASAGGQSVTELTGPTTIVLSSGNRIPAAELIGAKTLPETYAPDADGGTIEPLPLRTGKYALDWLESREGMLVRVGDSRVVGASNEYGETFVTTKPRQNPTPRGGTLYGSYADVNSGRLLVTSLTGGAPVANVGDTLTGSTSGPLDYANYGGYSLQATTIGTVRSGGLKPEVTKKAKSNELSVATYNVENLDPTDPQSKFDRLAVGIVKNLATPDIVSLEEIQDSNGAKDDGTVTADQTLAQFTAAIKAAGGPSYEWRSVDPQDKTDGGEPGGNIRNVFLFNPKRVGFVDHAGGDATTAVEVVSKGKHGKDITLSVSPGRINPTSDAWQNSRKPLVGEFTFRGEQYFVIGNHFNSKGGDQPLYGRFQPPTLSSEVQRLAQAKEVNTFVSGLLAKDKKAKVVVLGDLNDFPFSPPVDALTKGRVLTDLMSTLPKNERYSYVYDGNSQTLDHILVSPALKKPGYDVVHINAEFADKASDHDPQVARLR